MAAFMATRIRLLAIDIDGTLLDSRFHLSEANRDAVAAAHRLGTEIVLVTGRRFSSARPIAAQIPVDLTLIASNGALIKSKAGLTLARQLLPRPQARAVLAAAGNYRAAAVLLFDRDGPGQIVAEHLDSRHAPVAGYFQRNRQFLLQVEPLEAALTEDPIQVLFAGAVAPMQALAEQLARASCAAAVSLARTEYPARDLTLLDVLDRGCSKGAALGRWARTRSIRLEETMAIGDNWNDREMLEFAGLPVLMGNSSAALKRAGWAITASNDEDGVARAIEKFIFAR
ncbi:MAG: Cof-type HAD-IIB family hydrolase [Terriglobia bacterium]